MLNAAHRWQDFISSSSETGWKTALPVLLLSFLSLLGPLQHVLGWKLALLGSLACILAFILLNACRSFAEKLPILLGAACLLIILSPLYSLPRVMSGELSLSRTRNLTLNIAAQEFLAGRNPYHMLVGDTPRLSQSPNEWTASLDTKGQVRGPEPITALPGSILLALPFYYFFGEAGYQNIFWLSFLLFILLYKNSQKTSVLCSFCLFFVLFPNAVREHLRGSDLLTNAIFIYLSCSLVENCSRSTYIRTMLLGLTTAFLLSTRLNLLCLIPVLSLGIYRLHGIKPSLIYFLSLSAACATLNVPSYLIEPEWFTPLHALVRTEYMLSDFRLGLPVVTGVSIVSILLGSFIAWKKSGGTYFASSIIIALPLITLLTLSISLHADCSSFSNWLLLGSFLYWKPTATEA